MSKGLPDDEVQAVEVLNAAGRGGVLLLCEHASRAIPARFGDLGLDDAARVSHAAWDPGARDLAEVLSAALDSPLVAGTVSRLVYDCNRPPDSDTAMPARSEVFDIPGNAALTQADRDARVAAVYRPFCAAVDGLIGQARALVTVHSFTPLWHGSPRDTEIGILHDEDRRLADAMLTRAPSGDANGSVKARTVHRNRPYGPQDGVTHSLRLHAIPRALPNVMIEVRNDLLTTPQDIQSVARDLLAMLTPALEAMHA